METQSVADCYSSSDMTLVVRSCLQHGLDLATGQAAGLCHLLPMFLVS